MRNSDGMSNKPKGHPGNKYGTKLKDPEVRQEAYRQYCAHIGSGMPKQSFVFKHPDHSVTWETLDRYIAENPAEFPPILMEAAKAERYDHWFREGVALVRGQHKGGSPVVWQTIMRNMFRNLNWDREEIAENNRSHVERIASAIRDDGVVTEAEGCDPELYPEN